MTKSYNYEKRIHYEKRYLHKHPSCTTAFLSKDEFYFVKAHAKTFIKFLQDLSEQNLTDNNYFRQMFAYFENIMPDFLDGFFGMIANAHLLKTSSVLFHKEAELTKINRYEFLDSQKEKENFEFDFPDYVLWSVNTISEYFFITDDWIYFLLDFFNKIIEKTTRKITDEEIAEYVKELDTWFCSLVPWTNYTIFTQVWFLYVMELKTRLKYNNW